MRFFRSLSLQKIEHSHTSCTQTANTSVTAQQKQWYFPHPTQDIGTCWLSGVCMLFPCFWGFPLAIPVNPTIQKHRCWASLKTDSSSPRCEGDRYQCVTSPGCIPWQLLLRYKLGRIINGKIVENSDKSTTFLAPLGVKHKPRKVSVSLFISQEKTWIVKPLNFDLLPLKDVFLQLYFADFPSVVLLMAADSSKHNNVKFNLGGTHPQLMTQQCYSIWALLKGFAWEMYTMAKHMGLIISPQEQQLENIKFKKWNSGQR